MGERPPPWRRAKRGGGRRVDVKWGTGPPPGAGLRE